MEVPSPGERREQEPLCLQRTLWPRHWIIIIKVALSFCPKMAETLHPPPNRVSNPCGISAILDRDAADSAEKIPRKPKLKNPTWVSSPKLEPAPGGAGCLALDEDSPGLVGSLGWGASRRAPALGPPQLPISSATTALGSLLPLQLLKKTPSTMCACGQAGDRKGPAEMAGRPTQGKVGPQEWGPHSQSASPLKEE
jgi:hypothetical protein